MFAQDERRVRAGAHAGALCGAPAHVGKGGTVHSSACTRPALSAVHLKMRQEIRGPETLSAPSLRVGCGEVSLSDVFLPQTQRSLGELRNASVPALCRSFSVSFPSPSQRQAATADL